MGKTEVPKTKPRERFHHSNYLIVPEFVGHLDHCHFRLLLSEANELKIC